MWIAFAVVIGVVVAWVLVDRWRTSRDEQLHRGSSAWAQDGPGKTFHSTGWEETLPPHTAVIQDLEAARRRNRPHAAN
jgi:hypothetical protein